MKIDQQFINLQLAQIRAMQNDITFLERKKEADQQRAAELKRRAAQVREKAKQKAAERREAGLPAEDPKRQAKEILKSRRIKNEMAKLRELDKVLPARVGGPDLKGKVLVKLDERTSVYAKPGYNLEDLKEKYLKRERDILPIRDNSADKAHRKPQHQYPDGIYNLAHLVKIGGQL